MIFMCSMACAFALLALSAGVALLIWGFRNDGVGVALAKVFGFIITIMASLLFLSVSYSCLSNLSRGNYHMMGYHKMHKKCGCHHGDKKQFCDKHMKNKLEAQVN